MFADNALPDSVPNDPEPPPPDSATAEPGSEEPSGVDSSSAEPSESVKPDFIHTDETGKEWTAEELNSGIRLQSDYTRKTQDLAEDRKKTDAKYTRMAEVSAQIQKRDPEMYAHLVDDTGNVPFPETKPDFTEDPEGEKIWNLEQRIKQIEGDAKRNNLQTALVQGFSNAEQIAKSHGRELDRPALIAHMQKNNMSDPTMAYKDMAFDVIAKENSTIADETRKKVLAEVRAGKHQANKDSLVPESGGKAPHGGSKIPAGTSRSGMIKIAAKEALRRV